MKKYMKLILIILLFAIFLVLIFKIANKENNLLNKTKNINGIKFSNFKIVNINDSNEVYLTLNSNENTTIDKIDIIISDKKGNVISILSKNIGELKKNKNKNIIIKTNDKLKKAYSVNYTVYDK